MPELPAFLSPDSPHHSSLIMLLLLIGFAVLHSGGAALRQRAESIVGARIWRLLFAGLSLPAAIVIIGYFLAHRYDGYRVWNFQGLPGAIPVVWILTAVSFLFLYPATYNILEIPAVLQPQFKLYDIGIIRISRHPQAIGQILWCFAHAFWIGSSFMLITCVGLIGHHLFGVWHGDRRLRKRFGHLFEGLQRSTSIVPFLAVLDGRQRLVWQEFVRPAQLGIAVTVGVFWWAHRYISAASLIFLQSPLGGLLS